MATAKVKSGTAKTWNEQATADRRSGAIECLKRERRQATIGGSSLSRSKSIVGKKRTANKKIARTPREQLAARLRELVGDRPASDFAAAWDSTPDGVLKYLRGDRTPKLDQWPKIAASLGLKHWQDLLPPTK